MVARGGAGAINFAGDNSSTWNTGSVSRIWMSMYCEYSQYLEVLYCGYIFACTPSFSFFGTAGTYLPVL